MILVKSLRERIFLFKKRRIRNKAKNKMPITKARKQEIINELKDKVSRQKGMVFADFAGLKVKDITELKKRLAENGAEFKVAKKTLMGVVFDEEKIGVDPKDLNGEVALVLGYADEVSPARVVYEFSKENKSIKILGGYLENRLIGIDDVIALAKLPNRKQLLANLVGTLSAPARNLACVLQGNIRGFVYILSQVKK